MMRGLRFVVVFAMLWPSFTVAHATAPERKRLSAMSVRDTTMPDSTSRGTSTRVTSASVDTLATFLSATRKLWTSVDYRDFLRCAWSGAMTPSGGLEVGLPDIKPLADSLSEVDSALKAAHWTPERYHDVAGAVCSDELSRTVVGDPPGEPRKKVEPLGVHFLRVGKDGALQ